MQRSITRITRTIQEEMVKRWHSGSILYEAEEDKARADRKEQPAERLHGKGWTLRRHHWSTLLRRHDVHCQRPQCAPAATSICAPAPDDALQWPEQLSTIPAISISEPTTPSIFSCSVRPPLTRPSDTSTTWAAACAIYVRAAAIAGAERPT